MQSQNATYLALWPYSLPLPHDTLRMRGLCRGKMSVRPSVCLSVTCRYGVETAITKLFTVGNPLHISVPNMIANILTETP